MRIGRLSITPFQLVILSLVGGILFGMAVSEVKKVFMDENSGQPLPAILDSLHDQFEAAIERHATEFAATAR